MRILFSVLITLLRVGIHTGKFVPNSDKITHRELPSSPCPVPNGDVQTLAGTSRTPPFVNRLMIEKKSAEKSPTPSINREDDPHPSTRNSKAENDYLDTDVSEELIIEYVSRRGKLAIMSVGSNLKIKSFVHRHGLVQEIPPKLCDFINIVKIDLSRNFVKSIENIKCLSNLSTLILKFNKISEIKNTTFSNSKNLRILDLSFNLIKSLEPNSLIHLNPNGCLYDFSFNRLTEVDISNVLLAHHFHHLSYSNNNIKKIVHEDFSPKLHTKQRHRGHINLSETKINTIDFHKLGVGNILDLERAGYSFSFDGNKWTCDCYMQSLLVLGDPHLSQIWPNYRHALCSKWNKTIAEMQQESFSYLEMFVCYLKTRDGCPSKCTCKQDSYKVAVNCSARLLTEMPKYMPNATGHLYIDLSYNNISRLIDTQYLHHVIVLNLSHNSLSFIDSSARCKLSKKEALVITAGNPIGTFNKCEGRRGESGQKSNTSPFADYLYIMQGFITLIILLFLIVASTVRYRNELYCLRKHLHRPRTHKGEFKYDTYISMNENNATLLSWTRGNLVRKLQRSGYSVYFRPADERLGCVKEEEIIDAMSNSRVYIILLSDDYLVGNEEPWSSIEWRHAWNKFKQESNRHNIIVINYDFNRPRDLPRGILRAMLNLEIPLDFSNRDHRLHQNIYTRIGTPNRSYWALSIGFRNMNTKFNVRLIPERMYTHNRREETRRGKQTRNSTGDLDWITLTLPARQLKNTTRNKQPFALRKNRIMDYVCNDTSEY